MRQSTRLGAAVLAAAVPLVGAVSARASTDLGGSAGELSFACAIWNGAPGTGESVDLCTIESTGAGLDVVDTTLAPFGPEALVVWQHSCGTAAACTPYYHWASLPRTDFSVGPLETSATLSTTVGGCPLSFRLASKPSSPADGIGASATPTAYLSDPSVGAGGGADHAVLATGTGSVCNDPLGHGTVGTASFIYRVAAANAHAMNTGSKLFPILTNAPTWTMHGVVTDPHGKPIAGAYITDDHAFTYSDASGHYTFKDDVVAPSQDFWAWAQGYNGELKPVSILDSQSEVDFVLTPTS